MVLQIKLVMSTCSVRDRPVLIYLLSRAIVVFCISGKLPAGLLDLKVETAYSVKQMN